MSDAEIARLRLAVELQQQYVTQLTKMLREAREQLADGASEELREWYANG